MKQPKLYTRLPGRRWLIIRQCSLWQGSDHLLSLDRTLSEEVYRRYHFNDIQAMIVRPTAAWHIVSLIVGVLLLLFLLPPWFLWQANNVEGALAAIFPAAFFLLMLLIHLFRGRSCRCYLQMKVGQHELPALRRLRAARKLLDRIQPLIADAQKGVQMTAQAGSSPLPAARRSAPVALRSYSGRWHLVFYGALLLDVFFSVWRFFQSGMASYIVNAFSAIALLALAITALVAQRNTRLPGSARVPIWIALGSYAMIAMFSSMYVNFFLVLKNPRAFTTQAQQMQTMVNLQTLDHPVYAAVQGLYIAIGVVCFLVGMIATLRYRQRSTEPKA